MLLLLVPVTSSNLVQFLFMLGKNRGRKKKKKFSARVNLGMFLVITIIAFNPVKRDYSVNTDS